MIKNKEFYKRISQLGLKKRWNKEHSKVRITNKISKEKVSINAYLCGDGWIKVRKDKEGKTHYEIKIFPDNIELAKMIVNLFKLEFNIIPKIRVKKNYFYVEIKNKPACLNLLSFGKYDSLNWEIPKKLNKKQIIEWIKCFFDCEAYVSDYENNIQVKSVNRNGLISIMNKLTKMGITSKVYGPYKQKESRHNDYSVLILPRKDNNLKKYESLISFNHPNKKCKLKKILQ